MRRSFRSLAFTAMLSLVFALSATSALANENNNNRIGRPDPPVTPDGGADGVPCRGLYTAGVGWPPGSGGATAGTPGWAHVIENDEEMCHFRPD